VWARLVVASGVEDELPDQRAVGQRRASAGADGSDEEIPWTHNHPLVEGGRGGERSSVRDRLRDPLDEEAGIGQGVHDRADRAVIEPDPEVAAALAPRVGQQDRVEVRRARRADGDVGRGVVRGKDEPAACPENAAKLAERRPPVGEIV
jgi:hypothetical protein